MLAKRAANMAREINSGGDAASILAIILVMGVKGVPSVASPP